MSTPDTLLQAALARLGARLGSSLVDAAANLALLAQDAPEKLREEITLFWQEVEAEAERLEREQAGAAAEGFETGAFPADATPAQLQDQIDRLRAQVAAVARQLEQRP